MRYAYVKNGEVKGVGIVPRSFNNISGFNKLNDVELKKHGFMPYEVEAPQYDNKTHKLGRRIYDIKADKVVGTHEVESLTQADLDNKTNSLKHDVESLVVKYLYNTDWVEFETLDNETAFNTLRANLHALRDDLDNKTMAELVEVKEKLQACNQCLSSRKDEITTAVSELNQYLGE